MAFKGLIQRLNLPPLVAESQEMLHLDVLRLISACGIVLCHSFEFVYPPELRQIAHARSSGLSLFVDVFFVISGYVISAVYSDRIHSAADYANFIKRRVGRLYPLHIATFLIAAVIALAVKAAGMSMVHTPSFQADCLISTVLLAHSVYNCGGLPLNGVSWSISAEMMMYLLFPALLMVARRPWQIAVLALAAFLAVAWSFGGIGDWQGHLNLGRAIPAFIFGMFLYSVRLRLIVPHAALLMVGAAAIMVIGSLLIWPTPAILPFAYALPVFAIAAELGAPPGKAILWLAPYGRLTYSIYMLHGLAILVIVNGLADKILGIGMPGIAVVMLVTYVIIGIASRMSLDLFETPARRWIDGVQLFPATTDRSRLAPRAGQRPVIEKRDR